MASACSTSSTAGVGPDPGCLLGLNLWDTEPSLTWISGGRAWVRAGGSQACLAEIEATDHWWSPDGRRALLDGSAFDGDIEWSGDVPAGASQIIWHQPTGKDLLVLGPDGALLSVGPEDRGTSIGVPPGATLVASHPDADHLAVLDEAGRVFLVSVSNGDWAEIYVVDPREQIIQMEFSPDGAGLWVLAQQGSGEAAISEARLVDLSPITDSVEVPPSSSMVPSPEPLVAPPTLSYLRVDLTVSLPDFDVSVGATGVGVHSFVLHPAHPDWVVLTEGVCDQAEASLSIGGVRRVSGLPGAAVGFFRGGGHPILAMTTAGPSCGEGDLWVTSGPGGEILGEPELIASGVASVDIRDEAGDPWNPQADPPFA